MKLTRIDAAAGEFLGETQMNRAKQVSVHVVRYKDRPNWVMRYTDPNTGKQVIRSSGTSNRKEATKLAAQWEGELRDGKFREAGRLTWDDFRNEYCTLHLSELAESTQHKAECIFNVFERIMRPNKLRDITTDRITVFANKLRDEGKSENTIASYLGHLKAALRWAVEEGKIVSAPIVKRPRRAKDSKLMKGRPITGEEFDRMLGKIEEVIFGKPHGHVELSAEHRRHRIAVVTSWRHYLRGLWLSGLRLGESLQLSWDEGKGLSVDTSDRQEIMLRIRAEAEKGHKDRILSLAPDFQAMLAETPETKRKGYVFRPLDADGRRVQPDRAGRIISAIGKAAAVKVDSKAVIDRGTREPAMHPKTGEPVERVKYASAHDLRRSFGDRWADLVMPGVLQEMMRHESIETTMKYYVRRTAARTSRTVREAWNAKQAAANGQGIISGITGPIANPALTESVDVTDNA